MQVGPAWSHVNLTAHPLIATGNGKTAYLTLDEALTTNRFRIGETSISGRVPELKVFNGLSQPVLLLDGEELVGAKQNRVLNLTILVPANTEMTIPVSCVEAGRWQHRSESFVATDRTQFARGRALKLSQVTRSLYVSKTRSSDQRAIWREIDAKSQRMNVASPTAAMSAIYEDNQTKLDDFVRAMPRNDRQVGAVFSTGDKVVGLDAFDSADTFFKAAPKIVRSYAVDALEGPAEASATESANNLVRSFLNDIVTMDHLTQFKALGLGDDLRFNGSNVAGAALEISGQIVHIVSFPRTLYEGDGEHHPRSAYMMSARMRRTFH